jgi:hypothetical protein
VGHGVHHESSKSAAGQPSVLGQVFPREETTTTTSAAANTPQAPPTSQAPAAATTTTTKKAAKKAATAPTTTTAPANRTTTRQVAGPCGNGEAQASLQASIHPRTLNPGSDYITDAVATVDNNIDKAIQIDALALRLIFADGSSQIYNFQQALGSVVPSHTSSRYGVSLATQNPPTEVQLAAFQFHTAGQANCPGRAA